MGGGHPDKTGNLAQRYYVVLAEPTERAAERHTVLDGHLAWLREIEDAGILFLAGPLVTEAGPSTGGGMFILRAESLAEAQAIAARDPVNAGGYRRARVFAWRVDQGAFEARVSLSRGTAAFR